LNAIHQDQSLRIFKDFFYTLTKNTFKRFTIASRPLKEACVQSEDIASKKHCPDSSVVEHFLGKEEVGSSILLLGSKKTNNNMYLAEQTNLLTRIHPATI
jgi:hypothetical protein